MNDNSQVYFGSARGSGGDDVNEDEEAEMIYAGGDQVEISVDDMQDAAVGPSTVYGWYRRCVRKYMNGVTVIKVSASGKLLRRKLFIGAKAEYLELTSSKLLDLCYHLGDVDSVLHGTSSPDFAAFTQNRPERKPKAMKCLIVIVSGRPISLIFRTEEDRRDAQFLLRVQRKAVIDRWHHIRETFEAKQREAGLGLGVPAA